MAISGTAVKRRWLGLLALTVLVAGTGLAVVALMPSYRINEEGAARIIKGMSRADVEALLGVPAGDYSRHYDWPTHLSYDSDLWFFRSSWRVETWCDDRHHIRVAFDGEGKVVQTRSSTFNCHRQEPGFVRRIVNWLSK